MMTEKEHVITLKMWRACHLMIHNKEDFPKEYNVKMFDLSVKKKEWKDACWLIRYHKAHFTKKDNIELFNLLIKQRESYYARCLIEDNEEYFDNPEVLLKIIDRLEYC